MRKMNFLLLTGGLLLILGHQAFAQKYKEKDQGSIDSFKGKIKNKRALDIDLPGKDKAFRGEVNQDKVRNGATTVAGILKDEPSAGFQFTYTEKGVEGLVVLKDKKQAFRYYTEKGKVKSKEVNINSVMCVEYAANIPGTSQAPPPIAQAPPSGDPIYSLQSLPGAGAVVYLDFDGETVTDTYWNSWYNNGNIINAQAAAVNATQIQEIFNVVSEDFLPFQLNITTSLSVYNAAPANRRMRVVFTETSDFFPLAGGVAFVGIFSGGNPLVSPAWVFTGNFQNAKNMGEAASHEIGHTMGLDHDGKTGVSEYYEGHNGWAPIMGVGYYHPLSQWSKCEYPNAYNPGLTTPQDDLDIITTLNGFGYRTDEDLNTTASARNLTIDGSGNVLAANNKGIISKRTDIDYFKFTATTQSNLALSISPAQMHGDLDIQVRLLNSSGGQIAVYNPAGPGKVDISNAVNTGTYYLEIDGVGQGDLTTGYSDYGSLGAYSISGQLSACGNNFEPNESIAAASLINVNTTNNAAITTATDVDYYKLNVTTANQDIELILKNLTANLKLELLSSTGTVLFTSDNYGTSDEKISYLATTTGLYYVRVTGVSGAVTAGCYTLANSVKVNNCPAANEPNEGIAAATAFPLRSSVQGAINTTTDKDFYKLSNLTAGSVLKINLTGLTVDIDIRLLNSSGTLVAGSYNGSFSDENITYNVPATGTYYIEMYGYMGANSRFCYTLTNDVILSCQNAYEPNNQPSQPMPEIPLNSTITADFNLPTYDYDYYVVTVPEKGTLSFSLTNPPATGIWLLLYNSDNTFLTQSNTLALSYTVTTPGKYIILAFNSVTTTNLSCYNLTNTFTPECNPFEPNNTVATATAISLNGSFRSTFTAATDVDYFKIAVTERGQLNISLEDRDPTSIIVYNPAGQQITGNSNTGWNWPRNFLVDAPTTGNYIIELKPVTSYPITYPTQCYKIQTSFVPMPVTLSGNAVKFNGDNYGVIGDENGIYIPASNKHHIENANMKFSMEAIVKSDQVPYPGRFSSSDSPDEGIFSSPTIGQLAIARSESLTGNDLLYFYYYGGELYYEYNFKDGLCHHIAVVHDGINLILYIDGAKVAEQLKQYPTNTPYVTGDTHPIILGAFGNGSDFGFQKSFRGTIKEVRFWKDVTRAQATIQGQMNIGLIGNEEGLRGYWKLNESAGQYAYDRSITDYGLIFPIPGYLGLTPDNNYSDPGRVTNSCTSIGSARLANADAVDFMNSSQKNIQVYPNPFNEELKFILNENDTEQLYNAELKNTLGITVFEQKEVVPGVEYSIKENIVPGTYFLEIISGNEKRVIKLIKL